MKVLVEVRGGRTHPGQGTHKTRRSIQLPPGDSKSSKGGAKTCTARFDIDELPVLY